jgi:hypothetical protein
LLVSTVERLAVSRDLQPPPAKEQTGEGNTGGSNWRHSLDNAAVLATTQLFTVGLFAAVSALVHSQKVRNLFIYLIVHHFFAEVLYLRKKSTYMLHWIEYLFEGKTFKRAPSTGQQSANIMPWTAVSASC